MYLPAGCRDAFADLLPWPTLNHLITTKPLTNGQIALIRENRTLPLEMSTVLSLNDAQRQLSPAAIHALAAQGVSLVINRIGQLVPEIQTINRMLERHLGHTVNTNAYVSFREDSAFKAHWDDHNVLVLQLAGHKRWWLYGHPYAYPVKAPAFIGPHFPNPGSPEVELVMSPGDILFVPRGDVHKAVVEGENSLHLTIGLKPRLGHEVVAWLARTAQAEEEWLRRDVLPFASPDELDEQEAALRASLHRLVDRLDIRRFIADDHSKETPRNYRDILLARGLI
ncbi:MAG: cupin domain-containing protein, partial [Rhodospirillaceae bacterium]